MAKNITHEETVGTDDRRKQNTRTTVREDQPVSALLSDLTQEVTQLFRQEVELAKAEASEKVSQTVKGAISLTIGGAVAYAGLLVLLATAVIALAYVFPLWQAALIVAVVTLIIGMIMVMSGRKKMKAQNLKLEKTAHTLRQDKDMVQAHKDQIRSS